MLRHRQAAVALVLGVLLVCATAPSAAAAPSTKSADLGIQVPPPHQTLVVGQVVDFTVWAGNAGPADATGVVVKAQLPPELAVVSAGDGSVTCTGSAELSCSVGSLARYTSKWFPVKVRAVAPGGPSYDFTISGRPSDANLANNSWGTFVRIVEPSPLPVRIGCYSTLRSCTTELNLAREVSLRLALEPQPGFYGDLYLVVRHLSGTPYIYLQTVGADVHAPNGSTTVTLPAGAYEFRISCCTRTITVGGFWIPQIGRPDQPVCLVFPSLPCVPGGVPGRYAPSRSVTVGSGYFNGSATPAS